MRNQGHAAVADRVVGRDVDVIRAAAVAHGEDAVADAVGQLGRQPLPADQAVELLGVALLPAARGDGARGDGARVVVVQEADVIGEVGGAEVAARAEIPVVFQAGARVLRARIAQPRNIRCPGPDIPRDRTEVIRVIEPALDCRLFVGLGQSTEYVLTCLLYTSPSPRDGLLSRMPSSA